MNAAELTCQHNATAAQNASQLCDTCHTHAADERLQAKSTRRIVALTHALFAEAVQERCSQHLLSIYVISACVPLTSSHVRAGNLYQASQLMHARDYPISDMH
jgi:hypothetical protein